MFKNEKADVCAYIFKILSSKRETLLVTEKLNIHL